MEPQDQQPIRLLLLGKPRLVVAGRTVDNFPTAKIIALFAYLAIERHAAHTRDQLIDLFWPDYPPKKARQNLSQALSRLRRLLGDASGLIEADHSTVALSVDAAITVDVNDFATCIQATNQHAHVRRQSCPQCQAQLAQAVQLVQGELLTGVEISDSYDFEQWLLIKREQLHQLHLELLSDLADGALEQGAYREAIGYARAQIGLEVWRERAYVQLIRALALDGRRGEAVSEYERLRATLSAELGIEPGADTLQLLADVRADRVQAERQAAQMVKGNLPATLTQFVGRETEVADILDSLTQQKVRLLTICGTGGIGKTRISQEIGRRLQARSLADFADGVWFVPLVSVETAANIPLVVANTLGLQLSDREPSSVGVIRQLRDRRMLLIFDNFEHVLDGKSWLVDLLHAAPAVSLLVTTRERLKLLAEDVYTLDGLSVPSASATLEQARDYEAVVLFLDLARRFNKHWRLDTNNWPHVVTICRLLEGLPLGIELAITLLDAYEPATIAAHIDTQWLTEPDLLASDFGDFAAHQRSLYAVFDRSWERLSEREQSALARLSLIHGEFDLSAACAISEASPLVIRRLGYKSLLRSVGADTFNIHELLRQFAAWQLTMRPTDAAQANARYADYFLSLTADYTEVQGDEQRQLLTTLRQNVRNMQSAWLAAVEMGETALLRRAIKGITAFFDNISLFSDSRRLMQAVSQQFVDRPPTTLTTEERDLYAWAVVEEAGSWAELQTYAKSNAILDQASDLLSTVNDPALQALIDYHRGRSELQLGHNQRALQILERGLAYARQGGDWSLEISLLRFVGSVYRQRGDYLRFLVLLEEALTICRKHGDQVNEQIVLYFLGSYRAMAGDYWSGRQLVLAAIALDSVTGSPYGRWAAEATAGWIDATLGQVEAGLARQERAVRELQAIDENWRVSMGLVELATAQMGGGRYEDAATSLATGRELTARLNFVELAVYVELAAAYLAFEQQQFDVAIAAFGEVEQRMRGLNRPIGVVEAQIMRAYCTLLIGGDGGFSADSLRFVRDKRLDGAQRREQLYWTAWQVALACEGEDADAVRERGRAFAERVADQIDDVRFRESYLTNTPIAELL